MNKTDPTPLMVVALKIGVASLLFFSPAKVAFSQSQSHALSWHDVQETGSEYLMTVTAPPGAQPEDVLRTILENLKLPAHIRQPFLALARAKAPHLIDEVRLADRRSD